mgnify:CR=1 FL=1
MVALQNIFKPTFGNQAMTKTLSQNIQLVQAFLRSESNLWPLVSKTFQCLALMEHRETKVKEVIEASV